jgi:uncharacterized protein
MTKWLRLGFVLAMCGSAGWAVDWKALTPQGYVSDFANVLQPQSKSQLEAYCTAVQQAAGVQMALVTVSTLEGEPVDEVANTIFRAWGVGQKGKNEGILLLLAINDHRSRLEVGYGLEPVLPDGFDGSILRQMRPALRQADYGDALMAAAQTIANTIAQSKHVSIPATLPRRNPPPAASDEIPWPVVLGGILLLFWLLRAGGGGGFLPGLILGNMMGRSTWGGRGSGGFGGSDSGDGFGGFGGGDSGGGGASSDW